jgi:radical SAM superfamily enzyme YgiQ (UPF0313 family)
MISAMGRDAPVTPAPLALRGPGAICLVSCYELGHVPAGLSMPLAFLERAGFAPACLDLAVEAFDEARLGRARLIAISVPMHTALRLGLRLVERIRALNPTALLCFHGLYAQLNRELLFARGADYIIGGEGEATLVELAEALERGEAIPAGVSVPGRPAAARLVKLDFPMPTPTPAHGALPSRDRYAKLQLAGETRLTGYVEASRGCRHVCRHCPITPVYRGRFFVVPQAVVLEDVEAQIAAGARHITFGDPDFWNGPGHAEAIVRELHRRHPQVSYDATIKIEHLLSFRERVPTLVETGCVFVTSAVESLSDLVLERLAKGHKATDVREAFDLCDSAGLPLRPTWVPFTPWTTAADFAELLRFIDERDLAEQVDPVQLSLRLLIPPGSALLEIAIPGLGLLREETLSYGWTHPDPRMDELQREIRATVERLSAQPAREVFQSIWGAASERLGLEPPPPARPSQRVKPPRLTESWFCCAEPTDDQFGSVV